MDLKSTYNRIAEDWFKDHHGDTWWIEGTDRFASFLKSGALVLDVGCGAGVKSQYLLDKGLKVVGVDFSEKMIGIAKREVPEATFHVADIKDLSGLQESFDGILVQAVLLHIPKSEVREVVRELRNKLNDGGYLYIAVKERRENEKDEEILKENDYGYEYERFFSYFTLSEIKRYVSDAGLGISYEKVTLSGHTNWIQMICHK
ncbi:MAG: Methyltransferase type 11 [Candidatus Woesebacteria bacterium GW2011_GWB1_41_10]|uniref:Methyltransferase type 11 n=1 Tax=Candidatus Woesebacteria bacterium GW2011_GWB1_41_10 TaxID=1618577 RepID=A0A0G0WN86_9BACT|nr:MAG: Methyltransferase type 11 [Candidatus Woesebacteria bacterium GW2011_GWB1_41_10]